MLFKATVPHIAPALEQIHAVGADVAFLIELPPPDAVDIVILVQEHLPVHGAELLRGVDIKDKDAAGVQCPVGLPDGSGAVLRIQDIVQAVQETHRHIHGSGEAQLRQILVDKDRHLVKVAALVHGLREHILAQVNSCHPVAPLRKNAGGRAGTAGQVYHGSYLQSLFFQNGMGEIHPSVIIHIIGQPVIAGRQILIGVHLRSPSSARHTT